ncbi:carboxymuconolactone decarboxylase family protein [Gordonia sp. SID5947]|uniref:carboxymuconolactone decarboxylase family protein n=1 Tax=Gordonia sp. SID5947 TaxID=2690315 RepID=UPI00136FA9A5|nr:carboxymuconolactone decarboxylase family protein [Gordonia sp. SID5947]MYR06791.1 carboxymuconolactone decarboxylase family protein [Gordonia sp. SID5947]
MRLTPLPAEEWDDPVRGALSVMLTADRINPASAGNMLGTMVRNPALTRAYLEFNAHVLRTSALSDRIREIAVLRIVHLRRCSYLWDHHVPIAERGGLSRREIGDLARGVTSNASDDCVVAAVDELHADAEVTDETWERLADFLDERQRMDLVFTVGCYDLLAMAVKTFGIENE